MTEKEVIIAEIARLQKRLDEIKTEEFNASLIKRETENKYCSSCKFSDNGNALIRQHDGITCTHPTNQEGKKKYKGRFHTCQYWEAKEV